ELLIEEDLGYCLQESAPGMPPKDSPDCSGALLAIRGAVPSSPFVALGGARVRSVSLLRAFRPPSSASSATGPLNSAPSAQTHDRPGSASSTSCPQCRRPSRPGSACPAKPR